MAIGGNLPKNVKHGRTPNIDWTDVPDVPYDGESPDLPDKCGRKRWHDQVLGWWKEVRRMPHCKLWTPMEWQFCHETAYLKQAFWLDYTEGTVHSTLATEIRRREDQMGCTSEARRKLRIRYVNPDTAVAEAETDDVAEGDAEGEAGTPTIVDRRRRLTAV